MVSRVGGWIAVFWALAFPATLLAETKELRKGPACSVTKSVDEHLIQIYVTPPKPYGKYVPGQLHVFLRREHPNYLYVPLEVRKSKDGRLHVQIAISPEEQSAYSITVLDSQPKEQLISFWKKIPDIKILPPKVQMQKE